jgi:hypothetical protein
MTKIVRVFAIVLAVTAHAWSYIAFNLGNPGLAIFLVLSAIATILTMEALYRV